MKKEDWILLFWYLIGTPLIVYAWKTMADRERAWDVLGIWVTGGVIGLIQLALARWRPKNNPKAIIGIYLVLGPPSLMAWFTRSFDMWFVVPFALGEFSFSGSRLRQTGGSGSRKRPCGTRNSVDPSLLVGVFHEDRLVPGHWRRMMRGARGMKVLAVLINLFVLGCSDESPTEPEPWTGAVTLACLRWDPAKPEANRMITDVALAPDDRNGPTAEQLQMLTAHGARILHAFNVPLARIDISLDSLEALDSKGSISFANGVSFPELYRVHGLVMGFTRPIEEEDFAFLMAKNVVIEERYENTLLITVEDDSIPGLRSPLNEWFIELNYVYCGTSEVQTVDSR